ncbi:hypothetical protein MTsPCn7_07840 [Altererythrobacter sp. MTPC7]
MGPAAQRDNKGRRAEEARRTSHQPLDEVHGLFQTGCMTATPSSQTESDSAGSASAIPLANPVANDAGGLCRGISRMFARNGIWCLPEMPLKGGRRADLMGIDAKGRVIIVEIKVSRADLLGDAKWPDYLEHCDKFYWALAPDLDRGVLETDAFRPDACGIIVADAYDAEIVRPAPTEPLAAARRKVEVERLARTSLRRMTVASDGECAPWGAGE